MQPDGFRIIAFQPVDIAQPEQRVDSVGIDRERLFEQAHCVARPL